MAPLTPIAERISRSLDDEYQRMENEWFFKWHFIGGDGPVEIDRFDGRPPMKVGGVAYFGTIEHLFWESIQRYLREKVGSIFDTLEQELLRYLAKTRAKALTEVGFLVAQFATNIRRKAIEKDRVLRGNGFEFPPTRDLGIWLGVQTSDIESRIQSLGEIYISEITGGGGRPVSNKVDLVEVMIASPSDVAAERQIVRDVVHEWNAIHAKDRGIILMPVGWESHSSPTMGARPQEIINKQILKDCDLLVAVFWTKFGSPTGKAGSGTAEEIDEHIASGKPCLIYFSSEPVVADSIDQSQYQALKVFERNKMEKGLVARYSTKAEFREMLARQLAQTIIRYFKKNSELDEYAIDGFSQSSKGARYAIGNEARQLLIEAVKDRNGTIMRLQFIGGVHVQTNGRDFVEGNDARSIARWRSAVDELERLRLIEDRGGKSEVFFVTNEGYEAAEQLV